MKTLVATFSMLLLALITLPLAVSLLAAIPAIQNAVIQRLTNQLSEKLGAKVSVDNVRIKLINHIVVEGFLVEDLRGDTLLYAPRVSVPVVELGLTDVPLTFGRVVLEDAEMWIRRDSTGVLNIREYVRAIRGGRPPSPDPRFRMRMMGIEGRDITFGFLRDDKPNKDKGVDFSRFVIRNTQIDIDELVVARDTVRIGIRSVSLDERSGLHIDNISADDLIVSRGAVRLDNVTARAAGSELDVPLILLDGGRKDWKVFQNFNDSISFDVRVRNSRVTTDLLGWFAPAFEGLGLAFDNVSAHVEEPLSRLTGGIDNAESEGTTLSLGFSSTGLPYADRLELTVGDIDVRTTGEDIDRLARAVTGKELSDKVSGALKRLDGIAFEGSVTGNIDKFDTSGTLSSGAGDAGIAATIAHSGRTTTIDGSIATGGLDAGRILAIEDMGIAAGNIAAHGSIVKGGITEASIEGSIGRFDYRGYSYSDIAARGSRSSDTHTARLTVNDPALKAELSAVFNRDGSGSRGNLSLDVRKADLAATHLNRKDSVSTLSGSLTASLGGSTIDDIDGTLEARDLNYRSPYGTVGTPLVTIRSQNTGAGKLLSLRSEFADADFLSRLNYRDMFSYLAGFLHDYIPIPSPGTPYATPVLPEGLNPTASTSYSEVSLTLKDTDPLFGALAPGVRVAKGSAMSVAFNPYLGTLSLSAHSEQLQYRGIVASEVELTTNNPSDSLVMHLTAADIYSETAHIPDFVLHAGARGRQIDLSTRFSEENDSFAGVLGVHILSGSSVENGGNGEGGEVDEGGSGDRDGATHNVGSAQGNGSAGLALRFRPSHFSLDGKTWRIASGSLLRQGGRTAIDDFRIVSAGGGNRQRLVASGVVSKGATDTLHVDLENFDLSPLGKLIGRQITLGGRATGYIDAIAVVGEPRLNTDIDIDALSLDGIQAPPLRLTTAWNEGNKSIRFGMLNRATDEGMLQGSVSPRNRSLSAVATIDSLDTGVLDPLLGGVLAESEGRANIDLEVSGTFDRMLLNGRVSVPYLETTLEFTRARYTIQNAEFSIENSHITLPPTTVRDAFGGDGELRMTVDASDPGNPRVAIDASTRGLLVFDTRADEGKSFYGQVFATGSAAVRYDRMGTNIDISARTDRGTRFHLPLNAKSNVAWADFVTFVDPREKALDGNDALARARLLYEKQQEAPAPERRKPLRVGITAELTPEAELHLLIDPSLGNGITAHGAGVIDMDINPSANLLSMTGDYTISQGRFEFSMADVFNKDFEIVPGSDLRWSGAPEDALLDINTSHRVRTSLSPLLGEENGFVSARASVPVDCILSIAGRMSAPEITFDIALPSADPDARLIAANAMNTPELKSMQFLSLLMTGSFVTDNSITGQSATSGAMATGALGFDILTNQIGNFLSSEDYDIYFRYRPQENFLSNQFDVGFSTGILDNTLLLEIEGNYVDDRAAASVSTNASNLAGDVSLTWVIDRAGNLRLKVFTQTIDRLNETQGLQESGLGVYWKKDFDGIKDIFRRKNTIFGRETN